MDTGGSSLGVKVVGTEANHLPTSGAKVKNEWKFTLPLALF